MKDNKVLVLGASGGIGGEMARQLAQAGWDVHALKRGATEPIAKKGGITWVRGDALNVSDVVEAAEGCSVIVHAVNPPGYRNWATQVLPMLDHTIAAAIPRQATIVLPGTVYNFGPGALPEPHEDAPQDPVTRKGAIRVEMEKRLKAASALGAQVIIVRAGDFFGPKPGNSWFSQGMLKPGRPVKSVLNPTEPGVGHQWSYLPDVARTMVELLLKRRQLGAFERFHTAGHWDATGREMAEAVQRVVTRTTGAKPAVRRMPWAAMRIGAFFDATLREMLEMRYLWQQPVRMRNDRLLRVIGREPHTPLDQAVRESLVGLGCVQG